MTEHRQKQLDKDPVEFNFAPAFIEGDDIASVTVVVEDSEGAVTTDVEEDDSLQVLSGQVAQLRFDASGADPGTYTIHVTAETAAGDIKTLDLSLVVEQSVSGA